MRVIAGKAKGIRLCAPKGLGVRPTLDRVREALFNILAERVPGARFLDLYAGTGANGIEALSRGARECLFVDSALESLRIIAKNLEQTRLSAASTCLRCVLPAGLMRVESWGLPFDIVFADPPYGRTDVAALLEGIQEKKVLSPGGILVVEHPARQPLEGTSGGLQAFRTATYGEVGLSFLSREDD